MLCMHYAHFYCIAFLVHSFLVHCISSALHCIELHCIALHYIALHCIALQCIAGKFQNMSHLISPPLLLMNISTTLVISTMNSLQENGFIVLFQEIINGSSSQSLFVLVQFDLR